MISKDYSTREIDIDLQQSWLVLKRRWPSVMSVFFLTTLLASLYANSKDPIYEAKAKVLVEPSNQVSELVGFEGGNRELKALTSQNNPLDTQVEVFYSNSIAQRVISQLNIHDIDGQLIDPEELFKDFKVSTIPGADVLKIVYKHSDPNFAAAVVNTAIAIYLEQNAAESRLNATAAQNFILKQLPASEANLREAESELRQFKEANNIVDLDTESKNTVEVLANLENSLTNLTAQLVDTQVRATDIQNQLQLTPQQAYRFSVVSESPGVQEVLSQMQEVQTQLAVSRAVYQENSPAVGTIRDQHVALKSVLGERVNIALDDNQSTLPEMKLQASELEQALIAEYLALTNQSQGLAQQLAQLQDSRTAKQSRVQVLPKLEEMQRELLRELTTAQMTYETLLENLQQTQVIANQSLGNARLLNPARIPKLASSAPNLLYLIAGGIAGTLLGIMFAFISELLDNSVKTVHEGRELYDYPLLGVIPSWKKFSLKQSKVPRLLLKEKTPQALQLINAYQKLQSNLKFSDHAKPLKSIAITSAVADEGTSEVVANLALTLSQLGQKVLVIDTNMRNPSQQNLWSISKSNGLSNLIAGEIDLNQAINHQAPNLHVLTAGPLPSNPLALLESSRMSKIIQVCERKYDYIIIDTPEILDLPDMPTVGRLADGVLLVMQINLCNTQTIKAAKAVMVQSQQKVLGVVANDVKFKSREERYFSHIQTYRKSLPSKGSFSPANIIQSSISQANTTLTVQKKEIFSRKEDIKVTKR